MRLAFRGGEADKNQVDLFEGAEALASIGRIGNLVAHYVSTGDIRFRGPYSESIQYVLSAVEPGSFAVVIQGISRIGAHALAAAKTESAGKLLSRVVRRGIGSEIDGNLETEVGLIPEEDIDVLVEASEPALKRMHGWINQSDKSILLEPDGTRAIKLDVESKAYLTEEETDRNRMQIDVSVAAININNQTGRVWIPSLQRTVPFRVPKDAHPRTLPNLSRYVVKYADRKRRKAEYEINAHIVFKKVSAMDGRVKRVLIYDCEPLDELI